MARVAPLRFGSRLGFLLVALVLSPAFWCSSRFTSLVARVVSSLGYELTVLLLRSSVALRLPHDFICTVRFSVCCAWVLEAVSPLGRMPPGGHAWFGVMLTAALLVIQCTHASCPEPRTRLLNVRQTHHHHHPHTLSSPSPPLPFPPLSLSLPSNGRWAPFRNTIAVTGETPV